jgi:hypothetical protein
MGDLAKRLRAKYPGAYDDMDDAALERAVIAKHPEYADMARPAPDAGAKPDGSLGRFAGYKMLGDAVMGAGKAAINNPVQSLAILGGMAAAPLTGGASIPASMAAAGLGAAGGAGIGSIVNAARGGANGPTSASGVAKTMATEGALGATGEGVGQGIGRILKAGGKLVYKTALRPSKGLQREFGDVAETGLKRGAIVSEGGLDKVTAQRGASATKARQMVADAEAAGAPPIPTKEVAGSLKDVMREGRQEVQLGRPDPRPPVVGRLRAFAAQHPNGIPLTKAQGLKEKAQDLATRAYRAEDLGHPINDLSAAADQAQAAGLQKGIEARVPGVGEQNANTRELIGLSRALEDATQRNVPGVGSLRSLLGDFIPSVSSGLGIAADRASGMPFNNALKAALIAALGGQDE